ncbi:succinate semialdehyde dehydrogenase [gamma proteobacterium NOR5-3]|nr:succinate semialdehyde dehydrogenase [gamma proteobacterium NOR5-3]
MNIAEQQTLGHWINGEWLSSQDRGTFTVHNPVDDSAFAEVAEGSAAEINMAVEAAHESFQSYRNTSVNDREAWLARAAALLEERRGEFVDLLIDEAGSTFTKAQFETGKAVSFIRAAIGMVRRVSGETLPSDYPGRLSLTWREPRGVVAVITPFNVPLIKASRLCANALATGSTVVLLPSEHTPVIALKFAQLLNYAGFPPGTVNVVAGNGYKIGDSLVTHPLVKSVTFTGSTVVGKHIQELCAKGNKHVTLELGGKNPLVILDDASLQDAVQGAVRGMFMHQGQACISSSRIYVQKGIYPKFIEIYKGAVAKLGRGELRDPDTIIGPIISDRQRERIRRHISDAQEKGAEVLVGGDWDGNRCEPTVLLNVSEDMECFAEETFGPVVSVYVIDDLDQALAAANNSRYGLSSAIYTSDINAALRYAKSVEAGMVHINGPSITDEAHVPFGGVGDSGFGREGTEADIDALTELKWVTVQMNS